MNSMVEIMTLEERGDNQASEFLHLVDSAFIAEKSRSGSLAARYPRLFQCENLRNLYGAWLNGELVATTAVKEVTASVSEQSFQLALVGLVSVRSDKRGCGIGRRLIAGVNDHLLRREFSFAGLWTTLPSFYQAFNWTTFDTAVLGEITGLQRYVSSLPPRRPFDFVRELEGIRSCWGKDCIKRVDFDYLAIPASVDSVACFMTGEDPLTEAYALVGIKNDTGYVYEIVGCPASFELLWSSLSGSFATLVLNDFVGSTSLDWLKKNTTVNWKPQSLAMWLKLDHAGSFDLSRMQVPFYDRI